MSTSEKTVESKVNTTEKTEEVNGDLTRDSEVKSKPSEPCSQRKPKLNRRNFHLSSHPLMTLLSDKSDQKKPDVNGCNDATENKIKTDSPKKKIISLSSVKNSTSDKSSAVGSKQSTTIINLKSSKWSLGPNGNKNTDSATTEVSGSGDPPPKKKHKPITWP